MSYTKTIWVDRNVQYPHRYTDELGATKTFTPNPGTITEAGTQTTAARMNNIEQGIFDLSQDLGRYNSQFGLDNWTFDRTQVSSGVAQFVSTNTTGFVSNYITPTNLKAWGNIKVDAVVGASSFLSIYVRDIVGNDLITHVNLVNGTNIIDLSSIDASVYKTVRIIFAFARNAGTDPTPTLSNMSMVYEGLPSDGWEKISGGTIGADAASVDFVNISNVYKMLRVTYAVKCSTAASPNLNIRFNDDSTNAHYIYTYTILGTGASGAAVSGTEVSILYGLPNPTYLHSIGTILIHNNPAGEVKSYLVQCSTLDVSDNIKASVYSGRWVNYTDLINKISLIASSSSIDAESWVVLEGHR